MAFPPAETKNLLGDRTAKLDFHLVPPAESAVHSHCFPAPRDGAGGDEVLLLNAPVISMIRTARPAVSVQRNPLAGYSGNEVRMDQSLRTRQQFVLLPKQHLCRS